MRSYCPIDRFQFEEIILGISEKQNLELLIKKKKHTLKNVIQDPIAVSELMCIEIGYYFSIYMRALRFQLF